MSKFASPSVNGFEIHSIWTLHENEWNRADGWVICNIQKKIIIFFLGFKKTHLIEKKMLPAQQPTRRLLQTEQERLGVKSLETWKDRMLQFTQKKKHVVKMC